MSTIPCQPRADGADGDWGSTSDSVILDCEGAVVGSVVGEVDDGVVRETDVAGAVEAVHAARTRQRVEPNITSGRCFLFTFLS
jgi:hypothetical protein